MGFFTFLLFLFIKFLPMINIFEIKDLLHRIHQREHGHGGAHDPSVDRAQQLGASATTPETTGGIAGA